MTGAYKLKAFLFFSVSVQTCCDSQSFDIGLTLELAWSASLV